MLFLTSRKTCLLQTNKIRILSLNSSTGPVPPLTIQDSGLDIDLTLDIASCTSSTVSICLFFFPLFFSPLSARLFEYICVSSDSQEVKFQRNCNNSSTTVATFFHLCHLFYLHSCICYTLFHATECKLYICIYL